ncbi:DUF6284 family protein [Streptomyces sp. NPDC015532]|uniref:DUF6284 family protein n=1 Tax=Streptomyces sp. NPDC015532 TaxID=3364960 RepID=UPI0036FFD4FA
MKYIGAVQAGVTADTDREPSDAELDVIEREIPLILAEVDLLDVQITTLDRVPSEVDTRRLRRARNRVLTLRRDLANSTSTASLSRGAAC